MSEQSISKETERANSDTRQWFQVVVVLLIGLILAWFSTLESLRLARSDIERDFKRDASALAGRIWMQFRAQIELSNDLASYAVAAIPVRDSLDIRVRKERFESFVNQGTRFANKQQYVALLGINGDTQRLESWYRASASLNDPADRDLIQKLVTTPVIVEEVDKALIDLRPRFFLLDDENKARFGLGNGFATIYPFRYDDGGIGVVMLLTELQNMLSRLVISPPLDRALAQVSLAGRTRTKALIARQFGTEKFADTIADFDMHQFDDLHHTAHKVVGKLDWQIDIWPPIDVYKVDYGRPAVTAAVVLLLTSLVCFIIYSQTERASRIVEIVNRRTSALKEAHRELEGNYHLLKSLNTDLDKARRTAEIANASKSEFIATVSHELRTPLNAVLGFSQLLRDQALGPLGDARYLDYASDIYESGSYLLQLINDILDLAKLEAGKLELVQGTVSVARLHDRVNAIILPTAESKDIALSITVADDVPDQFEGDELRLRQILLNLGSNAVKFTNSGSISFSCTAFEQQGDPRQWIRFSVTDTGVGIPSNKLANLFDRFTQVDNSRTRTHNGAGLGLSICRELTTMMGGRISVTSEIDKGSQFIVEIPVELVEEDNDDSDFI